MIRSEAALTPTFPRAILASSAGDPAQVAKCQSSLDAPETYRYTMENSWGAADPEGLLDQMRAAEAASLDLLIESGMAPDEAQRMVDEQYGDLSDLQDFFAPSQERVDGEFQTPDRWHFTTTGDFSSLSGEYTVVADTVWKNEGGAWAIDDTVLQSDVEQATMPVEGEGLCEFLASLAAVANVDSSEEVLDGIATAHYHLGREAVNQLNAMAPEEPDTENIADFVSADLDMWIAQEGHWPVRIRLEGVFDMSLHVESEVRQAAALFGPVMVKVGFDARVFDINDPSIQIEAPAP